VSLEPSSDDDFVFQKLFHNIRKLIKNGEALPHVNFLIIKHIALFILIAAQPALKIT